MGSTSSDIFNRALDRVDAKIDKPRKIIPLNKIISNLKKTGSLSDTARILKTSKQNISQRLERKGIDYKEFLDYGDDKALSHEILQYRINNGMTSDKIQKMNGGSSVLAICQLQDKIDKLRGESAEKGGLQVIINLANRTNEIDITPA